MKRSNTILPLALFLFMPAAPGRAETTLGGRLSLVGVIAGGARDGKDLVVLEDGSSRKKIYARQGEKIQGRYQIVAIAKDRVDVSDGRQKITLTRDGFPSRDSSYYAANDGGAVNNFDQTYGTMGESAPGDMPANPETLPPPPPPPPPPLPPPGGAPYGRRDFSYQQPNANGDHDAVQHQPTPYRGRPGGFGGGPRQDAYGNPMPQQGGMQQAPMVPPGPPMDAYSDPNGGAPLDYVE